jgi:transcriptional regulator with XRE-family HTH domain
LRKSKFTTLYDAFRAELVALRKSAHLTQRQLAAKLNVVRSMIERIEMGERRVDVVELYWLCRAFRANPKEAFQQIVDALQAADRNERAAIKRARKYNLRSGKVGRSSGRS